MGREANGLLPTSLIKGTVEIIAVWMGTTAC